MTISNLLIVFLMYFTSSDRSSIGSENSSLLVDISVSPKSENILFKLDKQLEKVKAKAKENLKVAKEKIRKDSNEVFLKIRTGKIRKIRHKACFVFTFFDLITMVYLFVTSPGFLFPLYFSVKLFILITCRFALYRWKNWHYYLFDMCYFVNFLTITFLWFLPIEFVTLRQILWEGIQG